MSDRRHVSKKAPLTGAFFVVCCLLCTPLRAQTCLDGGGDEQVQIQQVFDGDTVELVDGRKVRLLGINSSEFDHDSGIHEPLAIEAREALRSLIKQATRIDLRFGPQRKDRHQRELAHLIIDERINAQQYLLQRGLAWAIAVPPNLWQQDCYQRAEDQARSNNLGVWGETYFRPLDLDHQRPDRGGFRLLHGRVRNVGIGEHSIWLDLNGDVSLAIPRAELVYFPSRDWSHWQGQLIEARGWLFMSHGKWRMNIRHPQNIEVRSEE